jgi:hypothetical protein
VQADAAIAHVLPSIVTHHWLRHLLGVAQQMPIGKGFPSRAERKSFLTQRTPRNYPDLVYFQL